MDNQKKGPSREDESAAKKQKIIMLEVKFKWKVNRITDEIIEYRNADAAAVWETLYLQPEELSKNEIISKKEKSGCDKKGKDVPEEMMPRKNSY